MIAGNRRCYTPTLWENGQSTRSRHVALTVLPITYESFRRLIKIEVEKRIVLLKCRSVSLLENAGLLLRMIGRAHQGARLYMPES